MTTLDRVHGAQELWSMVFPHCPAPDARQFVLWTQRFPEELLSKAFLKASRKFSPGNRETAATAHRYVTGLLLNLEREQKGA